jgi:tetratricopeptide (TPR) repeat protein
VLAVVLYFLPHQKPPTEQEKVTADLDKKVAKAVSMVQNAEGAPMAGIRLLQEVLAEDSLHEEANFQLGIFSIQSGQMDKAIMRFNKVMERNPERVECLYYIGHAQANLGNTQAAIETFERYLTRIEDNKTIEEVEQIINKLKSI